MEDRRYWERQAQRVAWHYNLGWWWSGFLWVVIGLSVLCACAILWARQMDVPLRPVWLGAGSALLIGAIGAYFEARRRFFSKRDGLVRLDVRLGLNNRLISAWDGVGEFPPARKAAGGWRWRWGRTLLPLAGCALLNLAAMEIPIGKSTPVAKMEPPSTWTQVQSWVEQLDRSGLVDHKAVEELREKLDALKDRPESEWYSQSALEAGDNLREQTGDAIRALQRDLQNSSATLEAAQQMGAEMSPAEMKAAQQALDQARQGLELGKLPLNARTLADLKKADLSKMKTLSPEQMASLQKRLREGASVCKSCTGAGAGDKFMLALGSQNGGNGGVSRGPGTVPLRLNPLPTQLETSSTAALPDADLAHALPGEVVGLASG
ncbi:MAG TPA: DUF4398 domain-containing protein, partial [Chthoniobacterales bacterium]|nr:DUF4398 domain-containing protein [Chthoniobacterales bacterium]